MKMALVLLHEKKVARSNVGMQRYLADLSSIRIETLVEWSEEELDGLHYPILAAAVRKQRRAWDHFCTEFLRVHPTAPVSHSELIWAMQAVRSRAFSGPYSGKKRMQCWLRGPANL